MRDIAIYGCGGFGREVLQILHALNAQEPQWNCLGFVVDPGFARPQSVHGLPVVDDISSLERGARANIAIAIGAPSVRRRVAEKLGALGHVFPTLVHPRAWIGAKVSLSEGVLVCANACLTTDIIVSPHVHLNLSVTVGHDAELGAYSTISPGANISGYVTLGEGVDIGTGATVIQGISIGDGAVIGAGAAVVRSIPPHCTAVGVPAKIIKTGQDTS
ncbi:MULTISPECIES: acetyltransferase [Roseobacteraceae]|uniref:acetyltransferase n=1 Tax=Roseobacteraceae TaxID=2854170 RepID=UPI00125F0F7F|nr:MULTISPECIES: acetyltransferase [Roseobacteraceae]KAB6714852.1 acetyltransferase [Roseobacter sp. TSBP12]